ncbi:MAG: thioredoxin family protein [Planctomycetota bacterium]|nr:thioredoxin family protein [Planctomycetota bacterium]
MIAASRKFVCVRLLTYECAAEEGFLEGIFLGRSGDLENTTFAVLAPDGKKRLSKAGRGPKMAYGHGARGVAAMAADMEKIAKKYPGKKDALKAAPLPLVEDVRRAVNVSACDNQPLVVVLGRDEKQQQELETRLAPLAWADTNVGAFLYVSTTSSKDLAALAKTKAAPGYLVVQPDAYGQKGQGIVQLPAAATAKTIQAALDKARKQFKPLDKAHHRDHVRKGKRDGVNWETEIPVTDPGKSPGGRGGRR